MTTPHRTPGPRALALARNPIVIALVASGALVALVALVTTLATAAASAPSNLADTPLIARAVLFGDPDRASVQLSPDGARLAFLAPKDGVMNVWVAPTIAPDQAEPVTDDHDRGIAAYAWAYTSKHLIYLQDQAGDEHWRVYAVEADSAEVVELTPLDGVQARLTHASPRHPEHVLVALNERVPQLHDLYLIDIVSGERELVLHNDQDLLSFLVDDDFVVRFASRPTAAGGVEILARVDDVWVSFTTVGMEDALTTGPIALDRSGDVLYMLDSRNRDTAALTAVDLASGEREVLFEDPRADVSGAIIHPREGTVQAAASTYERTRWTALEARFAADLEVLQEVDEGDVNLISRTYDDEVWIVAFTRDTSPVRYYVFDRAVGEATFLFTNRTDLEGQPLAPMHPVVIEARDGLELVSYLSLPVRAAPDGSLRPDEPLPLVLTVHGGPWARDNWGYSAVHQWLANRGYGALAVNFRGSTGFGKAFLNAGNLEWGAAMQDDLLDAVHWAIDEGIADPERVAIMGGSYGGYATLAGLAFHPEIFAAGVSIVGPSNLITLLEAIPPYWEPQVELFATRVGDHRTDEGRALLEARSPLTQAESIRAPLLIAQGANDPRVPRAESDQMVAALRDGAVPVTYALYPDEGHGLVRPPNRLSFYALADGFLAATLGGRFEPIGDDLVGSSITVPEGAHHVPGLVEALGR